MILDRKVGNSSASALLSRLRVGEFASGAAAVRGWDEPTEAMALTNGRLMTCNFESRSTLVIRGEWPVSAIKGVRWADLQGSALEMRAHGIWQRVADFSATSLPVGQAFQSRLNQR